MTNDYSKRRKELQFQNLQALCLKFLNSPLVIDTDYELEAEPRAYKTEDDMFFFVPQLDDPVMSDRTILGNPKPIEGRYRYSIETIQGDGGSYWEPPDYDQVEIGREDILANAIGFAAKYLLDLKLNQFQEGAYWESESILEKEFPNPY